MRSSDLPFMEFEFEHQDVALAEREVAAAREEHGMVRSPRGIEVLTYKGAAELMWDVRMKQRHEHGAIAQGITEGRAYHAIADNMTNIEGEHHHRQRKVVAKWFTARKAEEMRDAIRTWVAEQMDEHDDGDVFDFRTVIGARLPATVYCWIVGSPLTDVDYIAELSEGVLLTNSPPSPENRARLERATLDTQDYVRVFLEDRRKQPRDDIISAMLEAQTTGDITDQDIIDVMWTILGASTDTTNAQMCLNLAALGEHPDQWQVLKHEPEHLANASLELMRFAPGLWTLGRRPMEPLTFHGLELTEEDELYAGVFSANRDPRTFEDPRTLDVTRKVPAMPLGFGHGRHNCVGRFISLVEQQEAIRALLGRWAEFEVADAAFDGAPNLLSPSAFTLRFAREAAAVG